MNYYWGQKISASELTDYPMIDFQDNIGGALLAKRDKHAIQVTVPSVNM